MEHFRALAALVEPPVPEHARIAAALGLEEAPSASEHGDLFLFHLYPYASVYLGRDGMLGGEARDRVAGFWRALHAAPPAEPDHLAVMLALHARLGDLESAASDATRPAWRRARHAHFWEHLMSWLPAWLEALAGIAPPAYRAWGRLLHRALTEEAALVGPAVAVPGHLAAAPPLADPRVDGLDEFVAALLAPVRSGMILTRADLARAAADLGLGLRAGERRYALKSLVGQDPTATLAWVHDEAVRWRDVRIPGRGEPADPRAGVTSFEDVVTEHWTERAGRTAALLAELRIESMEAVHVAESGH